MAVKHDLVMQLRTIAVAYFFIWFWIGISVREAAKGAPAKGCVKPSK
jgi:hypothetical protein